MDGKAQKAGEKTKSNETIEEKIIGKPQSMLSEFPRKGEVHPQQPITVPDVVMAFCINL